MTILTPEEKAFLDVFLHEATTSPFFNGPATQALFAIGVEYSDISYLGWAYEHDVPRTSLKSGIRLMWRRRFLGQTERLSSDAIGKSNAFGKRSDIPWAQRPVKEVT